MPLLFAQVLSSITPLALVPLHDFSLLVEKSSIVTAVCWLHFSCHLLGRLHGLHSVLRLDQNSILWLSFLIVIDFSTIYSERLRFL